MLTTSMPGTHGQAQQGVVAAETIDRSIKVRTHTNSICTTAERDKLCSGSSACAPESM